MYKKKIKLILEVVFLRQKKWIVFLYHIMPILKACYRQKDSQYWVFLAPDDKNYLVATTTIR